MKHRFISKRYWKSNATAMGDSGDLVYRFDDLINFSLGDPEITTDKRIIDATYADMLAGHTHYTDFYGDMELREEIVKFYADEFGHERTVPEVMVATSGCHAMWLVLESILDDGDEVIIHEPFFTPYPEQIKLCRGIPVVLPTYEEEDFQVNPARLEALITERTKALIINTPNNPTGNCFSMETMSEIARIAIEHDLIVVADDIYMLFSYDKPFIAMATLPGMAERTITIGSFSKDYVMTGWRVGYVIAPEYLVLTMKNVNENNVFTAPSMSQRAALHALRLRKEVQPPIRELYQSRIMHAYERVCQIPWMSSLPPKGSIYLWVNITRTGLTDVEVADRIFEECHVLTLPGTAFGPGCGRYVRLALTVDHEGIDDAFDRIATLDLMGAGNATYRQMPPSPEAEADALAEPADTVDPAEADTAAVAEATSTARA